MSADGSTNQTAEPVQDPQQAESPFAGEAVYLGSTPLKPRQIGLVPGAEVPLLPVDLPAGLRGHAREQVAERQMRDALTGGEDILELRPFHAPGTERIWRRALVADRARMAEWRAQAGREGRAVLPDYLALPAAEEVWTVTLSGGMVLARLGVEDGFAAPPEVARHLLEQALRDPAPAPRAIYAPHGLSPALETVFAAHDIPVATDPDAVQRLGAAVPKALSHGELGFDLRRDPRAARQRLARDVLPWRWPLLTGLVAMGLWAVAQMLALQGLEAQTRAHRTTTLESVRQVFVPTGPVLDVRTQVSRALAEARVAAAGMGETVSPLDLLGLTAEVMTAAGAAPILVDYTATEGLRVAARVANFAAAEDLATALRDAGLVVSVAEARVSDEEEGVRTEMRIAAPEVRE